MSIALLTDRPIEFSKESGPTFGLMPPKAHGAPIPVAAGEQLLTPRSPGESRPRCAKSVMLAAPLLVAVIGCRGVQPPGADAAVILAAPQAANVEAMAACAAGTFRKDASPV